MTSEPLEHGPIDPVEANMRRIFELGMDFMSDRQAVLESLDHVTPLNEAAQAGRAATRAHINRVIEGLDEAMLEARDVIHLSQITDPIDPTFAQELLTGLVEAGDDEAFRREGIGKLVEELAIRTRLAEMEEASQTTATAKLSHDREISVSQGIDTSKVSMDLPLAIDTSLIYNVDLGTDAVTRILGAPLSDEDYRAIADLLVENTDGLALEAIEGYRSAVRAWASDLVLTGQESKPLQNRRRQANSALMAATNRDPLISEVITHAVYTATLREFPELKHIPSPQPWTN